MCKNMLEVLYHLARFGGALTLHATVGAKNLEFLLHGICYGTVCVSHIGVVLKWLNIGLCKQRCTIAQGLYFSDAKYCCEIRPELTPNSVAHCGLPF